MRNNNVVAAIDIGSFKIRTVIALYEEEREYPHVIGIGSSFSNGLRKWNVVSIKDLIEDINLTLEEAETMSGIPVQSVFISVGNSQIQSTPSKWVIAVSGNEITEADVSRVLEACQAISIPQNRHVMEVIPRSFKVDGDENISNPVGMSGIRLECDANVVTTYEQTRKNLEKSIHQVGAEVLKMIPATIASSNAVLTRKQRELGVLNIDIGASSTGISVYEEGVNLFSGSIPIGGEHVTNDIAIGLKTSIETAEKIKIEYGFTDPESVNEREEFDLSIVSNIDNGIVSKKELAMIIRARYEEIFFMVKQVLQSIGRDGMLPSGVIITGGGSKIPGLANIAKEILSLPTQIGFPQEITSVHDKIDDPEYATVLGLVKSSTMYDTYAMGNSSMPSIGEGFRSILDWFKNLLPH